MSLRRHRRYSLTRHRQFLWALPAFGVLLVAALWTATWLYLASTERNLIGTVTRETESFVASFEQYTRRAIKDADRMAALVKDEFEQRQSTDLTRLVRAGLIDGTGLMVVSVADANGNVIARSQPAARVNIADREYFQLHAAQDTGMLDISRPVVSRVNGRSAIILSRRLNRADHAFAGVAVVVVPPEYFMAYYNEGDLGRQGSLGLMGLDGTFRARSVGGNATAAPVGSGAELVTRAFAKPNGHYQSTSDGDGIMRISAYRKLADIPFIVTAAQARDEAFAEFQRMRRDYLITATLATAVIVAFFAILTVLAFRLQRHRGELQVQRTLLQTLLDNVPSGITVRSMQPGAMGKYVLWSESNSLLFGITQEHALGKTLRDVMPANNAAQLEELDRQLLASPMVQDLIQVRDLPGKARRIFHIVRAPIFGADQQVDYIMTCIVDITDERARGDALRLASKVFESTADAIVFSDADDRVIAVNAAFTTLTGYDATEIVGSVLAESPFRPIDRTESIARMVRLHRDGFVTGEVSRFRKDGSPLSLWITASCVRDDAGTITNYARVWTDISLMKETQQKLEQLASFDTLTGLPNRRLLLDRLEQATRRAQRTGEITVVMFIDLDRFKEVNDSHGHAIGDLLLQESAARLQQCIRASDSIGRLGGDEFAVVLEDAVVPTDATQVGERIIAALSKPLLIDGHRVEIAASVGIAIYPEGGTDAASLLKNADMAMYEAKQAGRNRYEIYSPVSKLMIR